MNNFINLLESTHLIYKLPPFGYGKEILRARYKVYLADAAISPSVLLKGLSLLACYWLGKTELDELPEE